MKTLYIDYTHSVPRRQAKVHGGGNYTRTLLVNILHYLEETSSSHKIVVLWPKDYLPSTDVEKKIYESKLVEIQDVEKSIDEVNYEPDATIFIPLLGVKEFPLLKSLKKKKINIVLTIHGLRLLDYKIDLYNTCYVSGLLAKMKALIQELFLPIRQIVYKCSIKKYTKYVDTIITVSNYTLARMAKYCHLNNALLQFQGSYLEPNDFHNGEFDKSEDYILFVSGNRSEKNLARTIDAYKCYLECSDKKKALYVVGTGPQTRKALIRSLKLDSLVDERCILFFDYVDDNELVALYRHASFLLYTSKSEGFGLPALEAAKFGCPVVAAYGTSIPEVLGTNCMYVNPYSIDSIKTGIAEMSKDENRVYYKSNIDKVFQDLIPRIQNSTNFIIKELLKR